METFLHAEGIYSAYYDSLRLGRTYTVWGMQNSTSFPAIYGTFLVLYPKLIELSHMWILILSFGRITYLFLLLLKLFSFPGYYSL